MSEQRVPVRIYKLMVLSTLCFVSFAIVAPVLEQLIRARFGGGSELTGRFMGIHGIASLVCGVIAGIVSDRLGRRVPVIIVAMIGSGVTTTLIPLIQDFSWLLLVRFADGVFGAFSLTVIWTYTLDLASGANRGRIMGIMSLSVAGGFIIAPILTGLLAERSLIALFAGVGALLVVGGLAMLSDLSKPEVVTPASRCWAGFRAGVSENPVAAVPIAFAFVDRFTFGTLAHMTSLAVVDLYGGSTRTSSLALLGFWVAYLLGCLPSGRLCQRHGAVPIILFGSALYGACLIAMVLGGLTSFIVLMVLAGLFCAVQYVPSMVLLGETARSTSRGTTFGVWSMAGSLGLVTGLIGSGKLSAVSYALAYGVAGGVELALVVVVGILYLRAEAATAVAAVRPAVARASAAPAIRRGTSDDGSVERIS